MKLPYTPPTLYSIPATRDCDLCGVPAKFHALQVLNLPPKTRKIIVALYTCENSTCIPTTNALKVYERD